MTVSIENVVSALQKSWASDTCFDASEWSTDNPARGHCVVSSLVVQHYLGGELQRHRVSGHGLEETHYYNVLPDGTLLDTTAAQYTEPMTFRADPVNFTGFSSIREKWLAEDETRLRYELLLSRVEARLKQAEQ